MKDSVKFIESAKKRLLLLTIGITLCIFVPIDAQDDHIVQTEIVEEDVQNEDDTISFELLLVYGLAAYFSIKLFWNIYKRRCPICKRWNSMKDINTEIIDQKHAIITETRSRKNSEGKIIETWEVGVPATKYIYLTHRRCKKCGFKDSVRSSKTIKN